MDGRCRLWHKHRVDDLLACGIAGLNYDEFIAFTEAHCERLWLERFESLTLVWPTEMAS